MDKQTLFKISYGLFVLCAEENGKDNGCVINTLAQVTDEPCRVTVTVNKGNGVTQTLLGRIWVKLAGGSN